MAAGRLSGSAGSDVTAPCTTPEATSFCRQSMATATAFGERVAVTPAMMPTIARTPCGGQARGRRARGRGLSVA